MTNVAILQGSTVHIEASWATMVAFVALLISIYNTWIKRDERTSKDAERFAELVQKVEILWNLLFPAAIGHALRAGILEKNSPLRWTIEALKKHQDIVEKIHSFYESSCVRLDDLSLLLELSKKFEADFHAMLATNENYRHEAIVLAAFYLCRPDAEIFKKYNFEGASSHG